MAHLDPEILALLALGEDAASATDRLHLAGCPECRAEVQRFARPIAATRAADEPLAVPAARVWEGISATLGLGARSIPSEDTEPAPAPVSMSRRIRRRVVALVAVAAVLLVIGGVAIGVQIARPSAQRLATATLLALPGWQGKSGTAVLERLPNGRRVVEVTTTVPPGATTDHEVWLMTTGARRLVSLGLLHGTSGTFAVPAGVDVRRYRWVDVSDEKRDGNPAHSGDSIIRGALHS